MKKRPISLLAALLVAVCAISAIAARAADPALRVAADDSFRDALAEIAPLFTGTTGCAVDLRYGDTAALADALLAGGDTDVCLPADPSILDRCREKGIVDVALARNIVVLSRLGEDPAYLRAVVLSASPNRIQALAFLDFLVSETARGIFAAHGFSLP